MSSMGLDTTKPLDVERLRQDFPILHQTPPLAYFDNAATTQVPRPVLQAIVACHEQYYANVHRGAHRLSQESTDAYEQAREKVRGFLNAGSVEEIIFTRGTTESINLVARSWGDANLKPGDEILVTELEHHSNLVPWQQAAERTGAVLKMLPITDDGLLNWDALDELLTTRTKVVAFAAVSNALGTINPVEALTARAHEVGAVVVLDAAQSVPHMATDVQRLGIDFLAFSGHKMMASTGIGVLYGRRELLEAMPPFQGGGSMIHRVWPDHFTPAALPSKFEAGTPAIVGAIALRAAIEYLEQTDLAAVHEHERQLVLQATALLSEFPGVKIWGPAAAQKAGIISLTYTNPTGRSIHANDVAQIFDQAGVAVRAGHHCAMPLHDRLGIPATARISFYLYNNSAEVSRLGPAMEKVVRLLRR